jgi:hypothetical protein
MRFLRSDSRFRAMDGPVLLPLLPVAVLACRSGALSPIFQTNHHNFGGTLDIEDDIDPDEEGNSMEVLALFDERAAIARAERLVFMDTE